MLRILGVDTGFGGTGLVVLGFSPDPGGGEPVITSIAHHTVETTSEAKKRRMHKADDDRRRIGLIWHAVVDFAKKNGAQMMAVEDFAFGPRRNMAAAARQFGAWAVVLCVAEHLGLAVVQLTPQEVRRRLLGTTAGDSVTKDRLAGWVAVKVAIPVGTMSQHELDAAAVALAAWDDDTVRLIMKGREQPFA
jgi:Holliday junction resolvasome RuvABC endonuclease subunit